MDNININLEELREELNAKIKNLVNGIETEVEIKIPPIPIVVDMLNSMFGEYGYLADFDFFPHISRQHPLQFYTVYKNNATQKTLTLQCSEYIRIGCVHMLDTAFTEMI